MTAWKIITTLLVLCDKVQPIVEKGRAGVLICGHLVYDSQTATDGLSPDLFSPVSDSDELPFLPAEEMRVVLSPYPVKEGPSLAPDDHRFVTVYRGRVLAFFAIYNNTFDATPFIGKVYSISEE